MATREGSGLARRSRRRPGSPAASPPGEALAVSLRRPADVEPSPSWSAASPGPPRRRAALRPRHISYRGDLDALERSRSSSRCACRTRRRRPRHERDVGVAAQRALVHADVGRPAPEQVAQGGDAMARATSGARSPAPVMGRVTISTAGPCAVASPSSEWLAPWMRPYRRCAATTGVLLRQCALDLDATASRRRATSVAVKMDRLVVLAADLVVLRLIGVK